MTTFLLPHPLTSLALRLARLHAPPHLAFAAVGFGYGPSPVRGYDPQLHEDPTLACASLQHSVLAALLRGLALPSARAFRGCSAGARGGQGAAALGAEAEVAASALIAATPYATTAALTHRSPLTPMSSNHALAVMGLLRELLHRAADAALAAAPGTRFNLFPLPPLVLAAPTLAAYLLRDVSQLAKVGKTAAVLGGAARRQSPRGCRPRPC